MAGPNLLDVPTRCINICSVCPVHDYYFCYFVWHIGKEMMLWKGILNKEANRQANPGSGQEAQD